MMKLYGIVLLSAFSLISSSDESNGKLPKDFKFTHNVDSSGSGPRTSFMSQWKNSLMKMKSLLTLKIVLI